MLLRQYSPEAYKVVTTEYNDLQKGLTSIFRSSIMAFYQYGEDLHEMFLKSEKNAMPCPDFAENEALNDEMDAIMRILRGE